MAFQESASLRQWWRSLRSSVYGIAQILQVVNILRPPLDGMLIFGISLAIVVPFMLAMLALHYTALSETRFSVERRPDLHDHVWHTTLP